MTYRLGLTATLTTLLLVACGGETTPTDGGSDDAGGGTDSGTGDLRVDDGFEVSASFTFDLSGGEPMPAQSTHEFVLHLSDGATATDAVMGAPGVAYDTSFVIAGARRTADASGEGLRFRASAEPCNGDSISYDSFDLELIDNDADGMADAIGGTATGFYGINFGDAIQNVAFTATLSGTRDTTPPNVSLPESPFNPMDTLRIVANEPLAAGTTMNVAGGGESVDLAGLGMGTHLAAFSSDSTLPFGAVLNLTIGPQLQDVAGNVNGAEIARGVMTLDDPGLFAEDGFEGALNGVLGGDATIVSSVGSATAIEGGQSLLVGLDGRATLRIAIEAGDTEITMQARRLYRFDGGANFSRPLSVGAAGATTNTVSIPFVDETRTATGDSMWTHIGEVFDVMIPIPEGASDDVILDINSTSGCSGGEMIAPSGLLIDSVQAQP